MIDVYNSHDQFTGFPRTTDEPDSIRLHLFCLAAELQYGALRMTQLYSHELTIPGAHLGDENPLPIFRNPDPNKQVNFQDSVPAHKRLLAGVDTGYRVLPYRMQDNYTRALQPLTFQAAVLENDLLKATFMPELGGRLISLFYKPEARELLARNPIFQPANLAIRNAWVSGGIEWNLGQYGHALNTISPVFAAQIECADGEPGLRIYDYERCKRLFWHIDFCLPEGSPFLRVYCRVINPNLTDSSIYWWNNTAVPEKPDVRVLAPSMQVIYVDFSTEDQSYGYGTMPYLPTTGGLDASYPTNFNFASEYFYQCEDADLAWEAALDGEGKGLIDASTQPVSYRKMFCWGMHAGGRHWQDFLSLPDNPYIEIQSGMTPSQTNAVPMPAQSQKDWMQVYGYFAGDPARVHDRDYPRACAYVDAALKEIMPAAQLDELLAEARVLAERAPSALLAMASGWGALEMARRSLEPELPAVPQTFAFPEDSLTAEQEKWLTLLNSGQFPDNDPAEVPGEWLVEPEWLPRLASLGTRNWYALLHEGVMRMENGDSQGAVAAWQASIALEPSPWAYRNLAVAANRAGEAATAQAYYQRAWDLSVSLGVMVPALAVECLQSLVAQGKFDEGMALYDVLPAGIRDFDRIQILRGRIALELGHLDTVEEVLKRDYAVIREGETELSDLWIGMWMRREAAGTGRPMDDQLLREVSVAHPLPSNIDFLMFNKDLGSVS